MIGYLYEAFDDMDADGDNYVTAAELCDWRATLGYTVKIGNDDAFEDETLEMLAKMDSTDVGGNEDEKISLLEFIGFFGGLGNESNMATEYNENDLWTWTFLPFQIDWHFFQFHWGETSTLHTFGDFHFY